MNKVKFGVAGCGMVSAFHADALSRIPEAQLVACSDTYMPSAEKFAQKHGLQPFSTLEEMLKKGGVDAVSICTPSGLHSRQAITVVRAGKHVVCEKPMSLTLKEADILIKEADKAGVKAAVISQFRFTPAVAEIKRAVQSGALGKVVSGSLQMKYWRSTEYYQSASWRGTWAMDGGGALMNQGIHGIDVFRSIMGPVKYLQGIARTLTHDIEVEDHAAAVLEFESGAVGTLEGSTTCFPGYPRRVEICGTKGSIVLEEDTIVKWDVDLPTDLPVGQAARNVASSDPAAISSEGHERQLRNFTDAVLRGEPLLADVRSGRHPLEIILAVYESSRTGKAVNMKEFAG
ncbi:MAG TPA: Gfo/Idh/MocA family oxidoreductase [Candidatus Limnocylindria bacterium]|nr:Gfo/Idh/MocA family oxidoreductase [Candidatus Limnocylindria bacterium]